MYVRAHDVERERGGHPIPAMKPTKFMTNGKEIPWELNRRRDKRHEHRHLVSGRAQHAARYLEGLCRAFCRGYIRSQRSKLQYINAVTEVTLKESNRKLPNPEEFHDEEELRWSRKGLKKLITTYTDRNEVDVTQALAWDDLIGMQPDAGEVIEAREKEIAYIEKKHVWMKVTREGCTWRVANIKVTVDRREQRR